MTNGAWSWARPWPRPWNPVTEHTLKSVQVLPCADHASVHAAVLHYLQQVQQPQPPIAALGILRISNAKPMLSATLMVGYSA